MSSFKNKQIDVWIHCFCGSKYIQVSNYRIYNFIKNKITKLKLSGLYDNIDNIYIVANEFKNSQTEIFDDFKLIFPKVKIIKRPIELLINENPGFDQKGGFNGECDTFNLILKNVKDSKIDKNILYLHSKGFTYPENHPWVSGIEQWVRYFEYFLIHNWKKCQKTLETCDTTSIMLWQPFGDHDKIDYIYQRKLYSGNFWWSKSEHLKRLSFLNKDNHKWRGEHHLMDYPFGIYHEQNLYFNCPWTRDKDFLRCKFDPEQFMDDEHFFPKGW